MRPPISLLRQLLSYDRETATFIWKARKPRHFEDGKRSKEWRCKNWNSHYAGKAAFQTKHNQGYLFGRIFNSPIMTHSLVWAFEKGSWPKGEIDHRNGNRSDNRIGNLRDVSRRINAKNSAMLCNNTSGVRGVVWCKETEKWRARLKVDDKYLELGRHELIEDARKVVEAARREHGFSKRHGQPLEVSNG